MRDTKEDFCRHLTQLGFEIGASSEWVSTKFRRYLGDERVRAFEKIHALPNSPERDNRIYEFVRDLTEANLLRSIDPDVTVDTSFHLYQACKPYLDSGKRVLELGCWTGGLTSFIANNHPSSEVWGVDRVARIVELNREGHKAPNLHFRCWDYERPKPDDLPRADVLLCGLGINNTPNGGYDVPADITMRQNGGYKRHKQDVVPYFKHWRHACKDGGVLIAALRITSFGRFIAFLDAAQETGWTPLFEKFGMILVESTKQAIPCVSFLAAPSEQVSEDDALAQHIRINTKPGGVQIAGSLALAIYRELGNKKVLRTVTFREQSVLTHDEVGLAGTVGYIFRHDAAPNYKLALVPTTEAHAQKRRMEAAGTQQLLTNNFGGSGAYVMAPMLPPNLGGGAGNGFTQIPKKK